MKAFICIRLGLGLPDGMQRLLGLGLAGTGQAVQYIAGLVHPAVPLMTLGVDLLQRDPETHGTVTDGRFGGIHSPALELQLQ